MHKHRSRGSGFRLLSGVAILLLAGLTAGILFRVLGPAPLWTDDWSPPPGFSKVLSDLSAGRANDGELRMTKIFRAHRSAVWKRRALLALGIARLRRHEFAAASKALASAERSGGPATSLAKLKRCEALIGEGHPAEAAAILEGARGSPGDPVLEDDYAVALARALAAGGSKARGRDTLLAHAASPRCRDKARVIDAAARMAEESGDTAAAADLYRQIYFQHPKSRESGPALERLSALATVAARFRTTDLPAVAARARELIDAGDGKGAVGTWDLALLSLPAAVLDPRYRLDIAEAAIEAGQDARALRLLGSAAPQRGSPRGPAGRAGASGRPAASRAAAPEEEGRRRWLLGRALFGLDRDREAIAVLKTAAEGGGEAAAEARFTLATGLDQTNHDREALEQFRRFLRAARDGERLEAALWRSGWLSFRLGQRADAAAAFESLLQRRSAAAYHPSALYWLGRSHEGTGRTALAAQHYGRLAREHPHDYYGQLAVRRLGRAAAPPATQPPPATDSAAERGELGSPPRRFCESGAEGPSQSRIRAGCELELAGLHQDAEREYEAAAAAGSSRDVLLRLSEFALRRGDRGGAVARLKMAVPDYMSAPIDSLPRHYWEVLFPRPEWEQIASLSRARGLDPALICAVILQESAFNPLAVSRAGAMGLMQVLPGSGQDAARALGEKGYSSARLFEPAMNLRLGLWHFAGLLGRFHGSVELTLAAYNAGEARVHRWQTMFGSPDAASFIEEIPYVETRLYVKRILGHAAMYRAIYGS